MNNLRKCLYAILIIILLSGCSKNLSFDTGDMFIIGNSDFYSAKLKDTVHVTGQKPRPKGDNELWYYNSLFFENEDAYYLKTSTDQDFNVWIEKIDKNTFDVTRTKHTSIDTNCALLSKENFYVINNYINHLEIDIYDLNLSLNKTINFSLNEKDSLYPTDLIEYNNELYMICGVIENDFEYGYTTNYIFRLNKDFELLQTFNLDTQDGSFFDSVVVDDILYLVQTTDGLDSEKRVALGGNQIRLFDLKHGKMLEDKISLSNLFPFYITYDNNNRNLIIAHGKNGPQPSHMWTIYNLDTKTETIFPLDFSQFRDGFPERSGFFASHETKYYLLFPTLLFEYDLNTKQAQTYDLTNSNIDNGVLLTFTE